MPEILIEGVMTIKDKEGRLIAIVFNDMKKKSQTFFKVSECNQDDTKQLLDDLTQRITQ